jgi:membrane protease YdiL (CAAX protease family)
MQKTGGKRDALWTYFALTYAISYLAWGALIVLGLAGGSTDPAAPPPSTAGLLLLLLGGFAPSIVGVALTGLREGAGGLRRLWQRALQVNLGWKAYAVIVGLPILIVALRAMFFSAGGGHVTRSLLLVSPAALAAFCVQIAFLGPISEEFGWRGFALPRMLQRWSAGRASLLLGALWAAWHLPLFFVRGTSQWRTGNVWLEFPLFALVPLGTAFVYTWLHQRTGASLWAALLFHFTVNFCISFWVTLAEDGVGGRLVTSAVMVMAALLVARAWRGAPA